ncbi:MAG: tetratricopeptide repeat protein [Bacteroidales bacterium]
MIKNLLEIEQTLREGDVEKAHSELLKLLEKEPENDSAWYLLGGILRRQELWGEAINALNKAKFLNPSGPAAYAIESIYEIIRFQNTDLMNP